MGVSQRRYSEAVGHISAALDLDPKDSQLIKVRCSDNVTESTLLHAPPALTVPLTVVVVCVCRG